MFFLRLQSRIIRNARKQQAVSRMNPAREKNRPTIFYTRLNNVLALLAYFKILKMEAVLPSVNFYLTKMNHIQENNILREHRCGHLKSQNIVQLYLKFIRSRLHITWFPRKRSVPLMNFETGRYK